MHVQNELSVPELQSFLLRLVPERRLALRTPFPNYI